MKKNKTVKISYVPEVNDGEIMVECLDKKRIEQHGFGTFFWKLKKEEVEITKEAKQKLKECINREYSSLGDLFGFSIHYNTAAYNSEHRGLYLNYASLENEILVPLEDITIDYEAYRRLFDE